MSNIALKLEAKLQDKDALYLRELIGDINDNHGKTIGQLMRSANGLGFHVEFETGEKYIINVYPAIKELVETVTKAKVE